jgi:hypothetical protein
VGSDQEGEEVHKMAALADDAPTADLRIVDPMGGRNVAGIDAIMGYQRLFAVGDEGLQFLGQRGKAAVEAYKEQGIGDRYPLGGPDW